MRDDRIRDARCFVWITGWISWCKAIIKEKPGPRWIFHHDADVSNFIATPKAVKAETFLGW